MHPVNGHLEILEKGFGFLRSIDGNLQPSPTDTFVPAYLIRKWQLPEGIYVEGEGEPGEGSNRNLKLAAIDTINGIGFEDYGSIKPLHEKTSIHPTEKFTLTMGPDDITGKALDLLTPVGKGQRGLIVSPPKAGKTTILKHMARAMTANHPEVDLFVLLVDERPEEVTDFKRGLTRAHVLASSADESISQHIRITRLAINAAARCTETGRDAVVFIDSLTRMARAFNADTNSHGRTLTGGLGANAMEFPRKIFGAARNIENGGSLTVIATILVDTGSRMDDIIFQEFKGTGNMDLVLSRPCAEKRIFPAIHVSNSGTRNERLLMDPADFEKSVEIRRVLSRLEETEAMAYLVEHLASVRP